jgi:predicted nucleic acid-binding Zn finger protein
MSDVFGHNRQQRGLEIAATSKIERKGGAWLVPSQSGKGRYTVIPHTDAPHCTCPDHQDGGHKCKHLFAVEYVLQREQNTDGSTTITETVRAVQQTVRKVYPQNWRAYSAAQTHEKEKFLELLRDLCSGVAESPQPKCGRPRLPIQDAIFAAAFKVYSTVSARRFMTDLREAQAKGYITKTPHFNSILNALEIPN